MKRILMVLALLLMTTSAFAGLGWDDGWGCSADGSGCEEGLFETEGESMGSSSRNYEYSLGGNFSVCSAVKLRGESCFGCHLNKNNAIKCLGVYFSDSCGCEQKQRPGSGPGITDCSSTGSCDYSYMGG